MTNRLGFLSLLALSIFVVGSASAEGGSGGVSIRGGSGIVCTSGPDRTPVVLEDFLLGRPANLAFDIRSIVAAIRVRDPRLALQIQQTWNVIGPVEKWPSPLPSDAAGLRDTELVLDDFVQDFVVPEGCLIVQLAVMNRTAATPHPILLTPGKWLDQRGRDFLRLHETLYAVGDVFYGHRTSFLTRGLVLAALQAERLPSLLDSAVEQFVNSEIDLAQIVFEFPDLFDLMTSSQVSFHSDFLSLESRWATVTFLGGRHLLQCEGVGLSPSTTHPSAEHCAVYSADTWSTPEQMVAGPLAPQKDRRFENAFRNSDYFETKPYWRF